MSFLAPLLLGVLALAGELFLREALALDRWAPDLAVVLVLYLGTARGLAGAGLVALLGLLADGFASGPAGFHMASYLLTFLGAVVLGHQVRFRGVVGHLLLGAAGGLVALFVSALLARLAFGAALQDRIADLVVPRVAVVALAVPWLFPIFDRVEALVGHRPDKDVL